MSDSDGSSQPPEWMLLLENKQKKQHRLAHEIGAGSSCMKCEGSCPGLDLHFWRKLCRNCKCKKEDHDIVDDDNYLQFEILLNSSSSKGKFKQAKAVLDLKLKKEDVKLVTGSSKSIKDNNEGIVFDWVPPNTSKDLAAEYMQQLPINKMPITGSTGSHHRRQQLEYQIPLHDLMPNICHDLSASEIQRLKDYLENIRNNVVGQGRIQKIGEISVQYIENSMPSSSKPQGQYSDKLSSSINRNTTPRPFVPTSYEDRSNFYNEEFPLPPLELLNMNSTDLKTPSQFLGQDFNRRDKTLLQNPTSQSVNSSLSQLKDQSEILKDTSKSHTIVNKQFEPTSILNFENNNLVSNVNNMLQDKLNTVNNEKYALNNNMALKPLDVKLVQNTVPYHTSSCDKNVAVSQPQKSNLLYPSQKHHEETSHPVLQSGQKNTILQDGLIQKNSNPSTCVQHSCPTKNQEPTFSQIAYNQPQGHKYIYQPGFESAPQGYIQLPDQLCETEGAVSSFPPSNLDQVLQKTIKATPVAKLLNCEGCHQVISAGQVSILAERAGSSVAWHPQCFVCQTCKELLVDLIYFFHKGNVYCGRHYADIMQIPRCYACDELIFVNEYTIAEGQAFHVRHFCCFECDTELGGKQYIPKNEHPVCLDCYYNKYGKNCHTCNEVIAATEQGICWKHIDWHARDSCFRCFHCMKCLLGLRFVIKHDQPFCNKDCVLQYTSLQEN